MFAKVICALPKWMGGGHKRGKRAVVVSTTSSGQYLTFICPRCDASWTRKERKAPKIKAVA